MNESAESTHTGRITLADICKALDAEVVCGSEKIDTEIKTACGCDLMSDVLTFTEPGSVLLTGLTNQQVVRTAEMLDLKAIIFVRSKRPDAKTIQLAQAKGVPLLLSPHPLYESCGVLFGLGLRGCAGSTLHSGRRDAEVAETSQLGAMWWGD